jgi:hypothetical protein
MPGLLFSAYLGELPWKGSLDIFIVFTVAALPGTLATVEILGAAWTRHCSLSAQQRCSLFGPNMMQSWCQSLQCCFLPGAYRRNPGRWTQRHGTMLKRCKLNNATINGEIALSRSAQPICTTQLTGLCPVVQCRSACGRLVQSWVRINGNYASPGTRPAPQPVHRTCFIHYALHLGGQTCAQTCAANVASCSGIGGCIAADHTVATEGFGTH